MARILGPKFYTRPTLAVAQELLGKFLVHEKDGKITAKMITEVEAYDGPDDLASHASRGRTERTKIMFEPGGVWYVYFVYGMHYMLNIVVGPKDYPAAVLIRGVEGVSGPARVTKYFQVDKKFNREPAGEGSGLYIEDRGFKVNNKDIVMSQRIGVDYAGPIWSRKKYNFKLTGIPVVPVKTGI
jgi:DNA-3-methyladenine glycosylase